MVDGTQDTFLIYDPRQTLDAMHAALFQGEAVTQLPCPHLGARIETELDHMGLLSEILTRAGEGRLDRQGFYQLYRQRRDHAGYLRRLLDHLEETDRPYLAALLCQNAAKRLHRRRFHEGLAAAKQRLAARGIRFQAEA